MDMRGGALMPTLKYWDAALGSWQALIGGVPVFRQVAYPTSDFPTTQTPVNATSYGTSTGPSILVTLGPSGAASVHFYAQVSMVNVGGLLASVGVKTYPAGAVVIAPTDDQCAFLAAPSVSTHEGPGHLAATFHVSTGAAGQFSFAMNYKVGSGTAQMMRRRMTVIPVDLVPK